MTPDPIALYLTLAALALGASAAHRRTGARADLDAWILLDTVAHRLADAIADAAVLPRRTPAEHAASSLHPGTPTDIAAALLSGATIKATLAAHGLDVPAIVGALPGIVEPLNRLGDPDKRPDPEGQAEEAIPDVAPYTLSPLASLPVDAIPAEPPLFVGAFTARPDVAPPSPRPHVAAYMDNMPPAHVHAYTLESLPARCACGAVEPTPPPASPTLPSALPRCPCGNLATRGRFCLPCYADHDEA